MKLSRRIWVSIAAWVVLLVALIVGLELFDVDSVVVGGALGAFCGATLVVVFAARERAAVKSRQDSRPEGRYGP